MVEMTRNICNYLVQSEFDVEEIIGLSMIGNDK
jgi:hypothetical protein